MPFQTLDTSSLEKNWWAVMSDIEGGSIVQADEKPDENKDLEFPATEDGMPYDVYRAGAFQVLPGPLTLIEAVNALREAISKKSFFDDQKVLIDQKSTTTIQDTTKVITDLSISEGSKIGKVDFEERNFWAVVCEDQGGSIIKNDERPPENEDIEFPERTDGEVIVKPSSYKAGKFKVVAGPLSFKEAFAILKDTLGYPQSMWDKAIEKYSKNQTKELND